MKNPDLRARLQAQIAGTVEPPRGHAINKAMLDKSRKASVAVRQLAVTEGSPLPAPGALLTPLP